MSAAQVTEAHHKLAQSINKRWCSYDDAAQLIADSEAKALSELAMVAAGSADRNVSLRLENAQLRAVFPQILAALGNGACCAPDVSVEFIQSIPNEVAGVVAGLRADVEQANAQVESLLSAAKNAIPASEHPAEPTVQNWAWQIRNLGDDRRLVYAERDRLRAEVDALKQCIESGPRVLRDDAERNAARAERADAELKRYNDAVDAQPWASDLPIRVLLDQITIRLLAAEKDAAMVGRLRRALADAISTYDPNRKETLVTAERQEAWIAALQEDAK